MGGGEVASADGLRFVVPVRTLHAGYNSKYFHVERGVTYYNFTSDVLEFQYSDRFRLAPFLSLSVPEPQAHIRVVSP